MAKVYLNDIGVEIMNTLESELEEIKDSTKKSAIRLGKELAQDIREDSPKKTGVYAKGWSARKTTNGAVVHNTKKPYLTHVLEFGYSMPNGKRVKAKPHIYKNAKRIEERFEEECIAIIAEGVRF